MIQAMKAIILAAGKGSRISDKIDGVPKSTLKLNDGKPIIRRQVELMIKNSIKPIVCLGYKKELIIEALKGLDVTYYYNPFYSITNNIASLWFAINEFDGNEDIILASADLYYPESFLALLKENSSNLSMVVDSSRIDSGDFYFSVKDGIIQEYGPDTPYENRDYEYMGLSRVDKSYVPVVKDTIISYIENDKFNRYFEDMLISLNMHKNERIDFIDVGGAFWREFDFYEDYEVILEYEKRNK